MKKIFLDLIDGGRQHLKNNGMTYVQHLKFASYYSICCLVAACRLFIHSVLPCFFPKTGSKLRAKLEKVFVEK